MTTICLIPIKSMETVKSRLSTNFNPNQRRKIFMYMLNKTIGTLKKSEISDYWILSSDLEISAFAELNDVKLFKDCVDGLNETISYYVKKVFDLGYDAMYLAPDLPLIDVPSISQLLNSFENDDFSLLVPDLEKKGVNAILWKNNLSFGPFLGVNSYSIHIEKAIDQNIKIKTFENRKLQFDLDTFDQFNNLPDHIKCEFLSF